MNSRTLEMSVGTFLIVGLLCLSYLALRLGDIGWFKPETYDLLARFTSVSGLKQGAFVEIAGVRVGQVSVIELDPEEYLAVVTLEVDVGVVIQDDAIASIRTQGIIGDKFVKITPGGSPDLLEDGMEIVETEPAISLEELISKYIFESDN